MIKSPGIYMRLNHNLQWRLRELKTRSNCDTWEEFMKLYFPQLENPVEIDVINYFNLVWDKFEKKRGVHAQEFTTQLKFLLAELEKSL